jgi:hypothetical protein
MDFLLSNTKEVFISFMKMLSLQNSGEVIAKAIRKSKNFSIKQKFFRIFLISQGDFLKSVKFHIHKKLFFNIL